MTDKQLNRWMIEKAVLLVLWLVCGAIGVHFMKENKLVEMASYVTFANIFLAKFMGVIK